MNTMDVDITTFVTPHFFFVTENNINKRRNILRKISETLRNELTECSSACFDVNEIVGVNYEQDFVRAKIEDIQIKHNKKIYYCWLLDHGFLIKSDEVFKLTNELKKIEPLVKQVSLNNFSYLKSNLELGINGTVKYTPTIIPSLGVSEFCVNLLTGCTRIHLKVLTCFGDILIGELFIHKQNKIFNVSEELIKQNLIIRDATMFEILKNEAAYYMKSHLNLIYSSGKNIPVCNNKIDDKKVVWEDSIDGDVLENGRRRFKNKPTSGQMEEQNIVENTDKNVGASIEKPVPQKNTESNCVQIIRTNNPRLLLKLKEKSLQNTNKIQKELELDCTSKMNNKQSESPDTSKIVLKIDVLRKRIGDIKGQEKTCMETVNDTPKVSNNNNLKDDETISKDIYKTWHSSTHPPEIKKSPFSDDTSQSGDRSDIKLFPSGMCMQGKSSKKPIRKNGSFSSHSNSSRSIGSESDCPTVEITQVKKSSSTYSSEYRVRTTDSSTTSDKQRPFTKVDICKLISEGCTCKECQMACEDEDWDFPSNIVKNTDTPKPKFKAGPIIKPSKLLNENEKGSFGKGHITSINYDNMTMLQKLGTSKLLVHGESIPQPVKLISSINMDIDVYNNITRLNYSEVKKIQQYAFNGLTENQHVFMINNPKSGKTMAYLPIVASFIKQKNERYNPLLKISGGPIVVILCNDSQKCEEIYDLSKMILERQRCRIHVVTYPGHGNISNVDVLITIPTILSSLILSRATNFKRLCHFVLEDGDAILNTHKELIEKFLLYADQVLENRNCPISVQVIICAEHWTYEIENILKRLNKTPLVCIGNYLEAALYGKMNFTMKFVEANSRMEQLKDILGNTYKYSKSIVVCNSDDIGNIEAYFKSEGIGYTAIKDHLTQEDIQFYEDEWNWSTLGKYSVLVCSDDVYNMLSVTNVSVLIHHALPKTWTQFVKRFSCLLENIRSPLSLKEASQGMSVTSFVFIDENCETKMSKFSKFIKSSGLEKYLPEILQTYFEGVETKNEELKLEQKIELCDKLKMFGRCSSIQCLNRHVVSKDVDTSDFLPHDGYLKFKILCMTNTATASVQLVEHLDSGGNSVRVFEDSRGKICDILSKIRTYTPARDLKMSDFYLYKEKDKYSRSKLIENRQFLLVFLVDEGVYARVESDQLFIMPEELKNIPQQCFEVYFANLVPPYDDDTFCRYSKYKAQLLFQTNCSKATMKGVIKLQLGNNLWLSDVCEERDMFDKSLPSIGFQLTRELVAAGLAVNKANIINDLYSVAKAGGVEVPQDVKRTIPKPVVVEQMKPQWAFLSIDEVTQVMFSCAVNPAEFYVRNAKFHHQLLDLERFILEEIQKPFYPTLNSLVVGKCYLVKDEHSDNYSRALLLREENGQADVFFVDYGDSLTIKSTSLKYLRNDMILRLPFQSIQCCLHGVQPIEANNWSDEAIDLLYDRCFEPDTDIFRTLYAKVELKITNSKIERQNSYRILLKDGYSENKVLLNNFLIDCGFAISDNDTITDFSIDSFYQVDDDDDDELADEDIVNGISPEDDLVGNNGIGNLDEFELMIFDIHKFLVDIKLPIPKSATMPTENCDSKNLPVIKAAPAVDFITPEVLWVQSNSAIKITIKVQDVDDYILKLLGKKILYFSTEKNRKTYKIKLILFDDVEKTFQHTILGSEVRVTLKKCTEAEWPRLLLSTQKNRKVRYDVLKIKDEDKPKTFLDLGFEESSSDDENGPVYHVCSDMDSEYDYDIPYDDC